MTPASSSRTSGERWSLPTSDDWAGPGTKPTTAQARAVAEALAVVPLDRGGVQIELHAGGADIEIEVSENGRVQSVYWEAR